MILFIYLYHDLILFFLNNSSLETNNFRVKMNTQNLPSISEDGIHDSIEDENQSIEAHLKFSNEAQFLQNMEDKLQRLKAFAESLGPAKETEIGKELLENFQRDPQEFKGIDYKIIIKQAGKRIEKMKKAKKVKKNWSSSDMKVLIWVICKYAQQQSINLSQIQSHDEFWKFISSVIPGTSPESCLFKWLSERRYKITLHSWKNQEQKLLLELQKKYTGLKNKWKVISEELYLQNMEKDKIFRHPKQCRQHYASFLDPNIVKGPWSKNQDSTLLTQIALNNGQKKWCKLTKILEGRTQNAIKNRFQLLFSKLKKRKQNKIKSEYQIIVEYLKQTDPEFQIKKQRVQAVKIEMQEKSSVVKEQNKTAETIKTLPNITIIAPTGPLPTEPVPKLIIPIVLKHASNFRPFFQNQETKNHRYNSLKFLSENNDYLQDDPLQK